MHTRARAGLMLMCLILGALINAAVALIITITYDADASRLWFPMAVDRAQQIWSRHVPADWPDEPTGGHQMRAFGRTLDNAGHIPEIEMTSWTVTRYEIGWPLRSFRAVGLASGGRQMQWHDCIALDVSGGSRILPVRPIWSGFLASTLFYAAVCWMVIRGPVEARRRWRELHDRCGACGYPRGSSDFCTECGADLFKAWKRKAAN